MTPTPEEVRSAVEWRCCGCGSPAPDKHKTCACPTQVVWDGDKQHAWCWEPDELEELKASHAQQRATLERAGKVLEEQRSAIFVLRSAVDDQRANAMADKFNVLEHAASALADEIAAMIGRKGLA